MTFNPRLDRSIEIFTELGWAEASMDDVASLPIGTAAQQKEALAGLRSGSLIDVDWKTGEISRATTADVDMVTLFAIRLGVSARQAVALLRWAAASRGVYAATREYTQEARQTLLDELVRRTGRTNQTDPSSYADPMLALVHDDELPVPRDVNYLLDWGLALPLTASRLTAMVPVSGRFHDVSRIRERFAEHVEAVVDVAPPMAVIGDVIAAGFEAGWITREHLFGWCLRGVDVATRPLDRKTWVRLMIDQAQVTDQELLAHLEALIPLVSLAEPAIVETVGLRLLPVVPPDRLADIALACLYVKTKKARRAVLGALAQVATPTADVAAMLLPRIQELAGDPDADVAKAAHAVLDAWSVAVVRSDEPQAGAQWWQPTPPLWSVPDCEPMPATVETLAEALTAMGRQPVGTIDVDSERLLALLVRVAHAEPEATERLMKNVGFMSDWSWRYHHESRSSRSAYEVFRTLPGTVRNDMLSYAGEAPCVLSEPSCVDLAVAPEDVAVRLAAYAEAQAPVLLEDLVLALCRLTTGSLRPADVPDLAVRDADHALVDESARDIVEAFLAHPLPALAEAHGDCDCASGRGIDDALPSDFPQILRRALATDRSDVRHSAAVFPRSAHASHMVDRPRWEVDHELGKDALTVSRSAQPLPPRSAAGLLSVAADCADEVAAETWQAVQDAWSRGLLIPGTADMTLLGHGDDLDRIASLARGLADVARSGLLSVVWPVLDQLAAHVQRGATMKAGAADVAAVMAELAPASVAAVESGVAPASVLEVPGLRSLAARKGSSKAVKAAAAAVALLPEAGAAAAPEAPDHEIEPLPESRLAALWPADVDFGVTRPDDARVEFFEVNKPHPRAGRWLRLTFADGRVVGTFPLHAAHGVRTRGALYVWPLDDDGIPSWGNDYSSLALSEGRLVRAAFAQGERHGDLSDTMAAVLLLTENDTTVANRLVDSGLTQAQAAKATQTLLELGWSPESRLNTVGQHPTLWVSHWPVMTRALQFAAKQKKPPRWTARLLRVAEDSLPLLLAATRSGRIPAEEWGCLATLTQKGSATVRPRASRLADALG